MNIKKPKTIQNLKTPPPNSTKSPISPQKTQNLPSTTTQQITNILKNNKKSITINNILNLYFKPPQPKIIQIPKITNPKNKLHFQKFSSTNQLLKYLNINTQKIKNFKIIFLKF